MLHFGIMPLPNQTSPQGSGLPASTFQTNAKPMGELTPSGLASYPNLPSGPFMGPDAGPQRSGPNLGPIQLGAYKS